MAKVYLGLGSNLGDRRATLDRALRLIRDRVREMRVSSVYETPALLPENAPEEWNRPYWNLVAEVEVEASANPLSFLHEMQKIETDLGRIRVDRWAPRTLDIDLLVWEGIDVGGSAGFGTELLLPHPRIAEREFVLDPLAELAPNLKIGGGSARDLARKHPRHQPRLTGILNLSHDSFSNGGIHFDAESTLETLESWDRIGISAIEVGGESTRPGSTPVSPEEEWNRISPVLRAIADRYRGAFLKPKICVDTRHPDIAARSLELGVDRLNDVCGIADPAWYALLAESDCEFVLMHSLTVPPTRERELPAGEDPLPFILEWARKKLSALRDAGVARERLIFDPGVGFGKSRLGSLQVLRDVEKFYALEMPILVGHSRKSFIADWSSFAAKERDPETLGVSFALAVKGVDELRVHDPVLHHRAFLAARHVL